MADNAMHLVCRECGEHFSLASYKKEYGFYPAMWKESIELEDWFTEHRHEWQDEFSFELTLLFPKGAAIHSIAKNEERKEQIESESAAWEEAREKRGHPFKYGVDPRHGK